MFTCKGRCRSSRTSFSERFFNRLRPKKKKRAQFCQKKLATALPLHHAREKTVSRWLRGPGEQLSCSSGSPEAIFEVVFLTSHVHDIASREHAKRNPQCWLSKKSMLHVLKIIQRISQADAFSYQMNAPPKSFCFAYLRSRASTTFANLSVEVTENTLFLPIYRVLQCVLKDI